MHFFCKEASLPNSTKNYHIVKITNRAHQIGKREHLNRNFAPL